MHKKINLLLYSIIAILVILIAISGFFIVKSQIQTTPVPTQSKINSSTNNQKNSQKTKKVVAKDQVSNSESDESIPSQFQGTWYSGTQAAIKMTSDKLVWNNGSSDKDTVNNVITDNSAPLKLYEGRGDNGTYQIFHNINPNAPSAELGGENAFWIGTMTIDGKSQRVLALYRTGGYFQIYTDAPTEKDESTQYLGDFEKWIGNKNLDLLKNNPNATLESDYAKKSSDN